jgi:UDP-N-acetylmuramyl pentapeptide phosphotransferase/UDP-N-acetylglucosamine-1-phosphate transferase
MPSLVHILGTAVLAAIATACLVEGVRRWSLRLALLDEPNHRSSHVVATPRLGGLAFVPVLLGGLVLVSWTSPAATTGQRTALTALVATGLLVALVSLIDDVRPQPAWLRLVLHLVAAAVIVAVAGSIRVVDAGSVGSVYLAGTISTVVTVLWIAGFINAFNFMDGIDGIAGTQALVAGAGWVAYGLLTDLPLLTLCGALLAGTAAGFLAHNWSPARIFMGDAGSALLGILLATVPWVLGRSDLWLVSLLLVWPFVFDTAFTLVRRVRRGERLWHAHRSHLYQRLVILGRSHRMVAALYGVLATLGLGAGVALVTGAALAPLGLVVIGLAAGGLWMTVACAERAEPGAAGSRSDA